jgi:hypothetical protein
MKGCTFKKRELPSGAITWGYSVDAGKDENGYRKQIFKKGFARKADADAALSQKLKEKDDGGLEKPDQPRQTWTSAEKVGVFVTAAR